VRPWLLAACACGLPPDGWAEGRAVLPACVKEPCVCLPEPLHAAPGMPLLLPIMRFHRAANRRFDRSGDKSSRGLTRSLFPGAGKPIESSAPQVQATRRHGVMHRTEKDRYDCLFQHAVYLPRQINKWPAGPGDA
jgi:hypothetical protein